MPENEPKPAPATERPPSADARISARALIITTVVAAVGSVLAALVTGVFTLKAAEPAPATTPGGTAAPASPSAAASGAGEAAPFTVAVVENEDFCRQQWLVPAYASEIEKTEKRPDWFAWEKSTGGIRADHHLVEFQVQGRSDAAVTIRKVGIEYSEPRKSLVTGTTIAVACGEGAAYRYLRADLDTDPATITSEVTDTEDLEGKTITPIEFPYRIDRTEPENFVVDAYVNRYDVSWRIVVEWSSEGRTGKFTFGMEGTGAATDTPFRTVGSGAAQAHCRWNEDGDLLDDSSKDCPR